MSGPVEPTSPSSLQPPSQPSHAPTRSPYAPRYYRRVLRIRAEDSPNVRLAMMEREHGLEPSGTVIIPGVLPYHDYLQRRATWDEIRQCIGLDAWFWEGKEVLMFPPQWLDHSHRMAVYLLTDEGKLRQGRTVKGVGVDTGEGTANTVITGVDEYGVMIQEAEKTPDTSRIVDMVINFIKRWNIDPDCVLFDRGGGGKQISDMVRRYGYMVRTVAFGEPVSVSPDPPGYGKRRVSHDERTEVREEKYVFFNRRAQMYGEARYLIDPSYPRDVFHHGGDFYGFAIPPEYHELRRQLSLIPVQYDSEMRLVLPPKDKRNPDDNRTTLISLIGHSPDEADSFVLAVHAMLHSSPVESPVFSW